MLHLRKARINSQRNYRIRRVPVCRSPRRNWVPPPPLPQASVLPPWTKGGRGEQHSLAGEGVGGPNSDDWLESVALSILCGQISCKGKKIISL
jgi:hypothetical protein